MCYTYTILQLSVLLGPCLIHIYISRNTLPGTMLSQSKFVELRWFFPSQGEKIVLYLPGFLSILLYFFFSFCLYQVFLIGSLNTQAPSTMASRGGGRGRGRGQLTFNMEAVGIGKGDALPPPTLQPSPLFPVSVCPPFLRLPCAPR